MPLLTDLEPEWLLYEPRPDGHTYFVPTTIDKGHGIKFLCPKCFAENGGARGTHSVICWSRTRGTPEDARPGPGRWTFEGTGFHDLTMNGDPPGNARSIALTGGCAWHGYMTKGEAA